MSRNVVLCVLFSLIFGVACESKSTRIETTQPGVADSKDDSSKEAASKDEAQVATDPLLRRKYGGRVVAIADVHGDVEALVNALEAADLIDQERAWTGGKSLLVQTGDILDRGATEREAYELLFSLREQAREKGGDIVMLIGNHEMMNSIGDLRYVVPEAMDDFDDSVTPAELAELSEAPESVRGRFAAWRPGGSWAKKLAEQGFTVIVNDTVFVHGGIEPEVAQHVDRVNRETRAWLEGTRTMPAELTSQEGPLWSRAFSTSPPDCEALDRSLEILGVARMVVGHTVQKDVSAACDGKIWRIDAGMSKHYGGTPHALEIVNGEVKAIEPDSP